ncbi:STAS domain-containing protein [Streptomyces sp. bgisy100]|uniref:STAS domain-containing protein n=1 Tax=Streptomyces sp. bgisy100 TaxID=3413783 RepID=UPI003D74BC01
MTVPESRVLSAGPPPSGTAALEVFPLGDRSGVRVVGEIGLSTGTVWQRQLDNLVGRGEDVRLELSGVEFVDVAGVSALARAAQRLDTGRRMVLVRPPTTLLRTLEMFWPGLAAIEVTTC